MTGSTAPLEAGAVTADDREFLSRFESCTLPESEWTHLAHIRVAWICLNVVGADAALQRIREGIMRYNAKVLNRAHKYHETVTVAYTYIVANRMLAGERWTGYQRRIDDLLDRESPILLRYYSGDRLFSDAARSTFVAPDVELLPPFETIG